MQTKKKFFIFFFSIFFSSLMIVNSLASQVIPEQYVYGSTATGTSWTNPTNVRDNDTATYAQYLQSGTGWTNKLIETLNGLCVDSTKLRAWVSQSNAGTYTTLNITVSPDNSVWTTVYSGTPTEGSYQNYTFSAISYLYIGFQRYRPSGTTSRYCRINEAQGVNLSYTIPTTSTITLSESPKPLEVLYNNKAMYKTLSESIISNSLVSKYKTFFFGFTDTSIINSNFYNLIRPHLTVYLNDVSQILRSLYTSQSISIIIKEEIFTNIININSNIEFIRNFHFSIFNIINSNSNMLNNKLFVQHIQGLFNEIIHSKNPNFIVSPFLINPIQPTPQISNRTIQQYVALTLVVSMFIVLLVIVIMKRR